MCCQAYLKNIRISFVRQSGKNILCIYKIFLDLQI
jgi:hypothetical protein